MTFFDPTFKTPVKSKERLLGGCLKLSHYSKNRGYLRYLFYGTGWGFAEAGFPDGDGQSIEPVSLDTYPDGEGNSWKSPGVIKYPFVFFIRMGGV